MWRVIGQMEMPNRSALAQFADATATLARHFFSRAPRERGTWQLWYAGQMHGVAGLLRLMVNRQLALETTAALRGRKHFIPILSKLADNDLRVSDLARSMGLDESQSGREIKLLNRHNLVETVKEGRERWIRITAAGRTALSEVLESTQAAAEASSSKVSQPRSNAAHKEAAESLKSISTFSTGELEKYSARMRGSMGVIEPQRVAA